jgi:two-component system heavy metal sensor histidine kinase CusS
MLSGIRKKLGSLAFKLPVFYVISVVILLAVFMALTYFTNTNQAYKSIEQTLEIGPGYMEGVNPAEVNLPSISGNITAKQILSQFSKFEAQSINTTTTLDGNTGFIIRGDYNTGPVTVYSHHFPGTFIIHTSGELFARVFYYYEMAEYDDFVFVASIDRASLQMLSTVQNSLRQTIYLSPLLVLMSVLFAWFVTRQTVNPLSDIAQTAENISERNLGYRVEYYSDDEIGSLATSFNRMAERLERAFSTQRRFISDAAHELRTPLASMKTAISYALTKPRTEEVDQQLLVNLYQRTETMERLINELLKQARIDEDGYIGGQVASISILIDTITEAFEPLFEEKTITFTHHSEDDLYIRGDQKLLLRLLSNLLDNAAKHTPAGGQVSLEVLKKEKQAIIKVSDTGCGIAPEHISKIFDRFYRISSSRPSETGFGLGLSICQSIAKSHGGEIEVISEPGKGSTFTVILPLAKTG